MEKYHGKLIKYNGATAGADLKAFYQSLPSRAEFVDQKLFKSIRTRVEKKKQIFVMPNDVFEFHMHEQSSYNSNRTSLYYKLAVYGVTRDGSKVCIIVDNIDVFMDVLVPDNTDPVRFTDSLKTQLNDAGIWPSRTEQKQMKKFRYWSPKDPYYVRLYFKTLFQRKKARQFLENTCITFFTTDGKECEAAIETASNDKSFTARETRQGTVYYRKATREYDFSLGDWNVLEKYSLDQSGQYIKKGSIRYTFRVDAHDLKSLEAAKIDKAKYPSLRLDKTMVMAWDLETYDHIPTGNAPAADDVLTSKGDERAIIFMDGIAFHWHYDKKPMLVVNITTMPVKPRDDCFTIFVRNQADIIRVKALISARMMPDIITGFNDGQYDWPFILRRAETFDREFNTGLVRWMRKHMSCIPYNTDTEKWTMGGPAIEKKIKTEADTYIENEFMNSQGFISIDTRTIFRQLYPTAGQSSLNFFLARNKLESKEDMDYMDMFKIFRLSQQLMEIFDLDDYDKIMERLESIQTEKGPDFVLLKNLKEVDLAWKPADSRRPDGRKWFSQVDKSHYRLDDKSISELITWYERSTDVVKYCNIDSQRCVELLIARNVIPDKREFAILSYVSMYDCFYRAGGMKVRNLVIAEGIKPEWNIAFDNARKGYQTDAKYPGAFVVPPIKGLYRDHKIVKRRRRIFNETEDSSLQMQDSALQMQDSALQMQNSAFVSMTVEDANRSHDPGAQKMRLEEVTPDHPEFWKKLLDDLDSDSQSDSQPDSQLDMPDLVDNFRRPTDEDDLNDRPCTGLDFSSLYPSLMMAYNLSPEKTLEPGTDVEAVVEKLQKKRPGVERRDLIHEVDFRYGFEKQAEHEKELKRGRFVRHIPYTDPKTGEMKYKGMGLYPSILWNLYKQRSQIKKKMNRYGCPKEFIEEIFGKSPEIHTSPVEVQQEKVHEFLMAERAKREAVVQENLGTYSEGFFRWQVKEVDHAIHFLNEEWKGFSKESESEKAVLSIDELYNDICFWFNYYNSKQLALKVFMNTFYGETGNPLSPFFIVEVAGSITTSGKENIHMVKKYVESCKYRVLYGDSVPRDEKILVRVNKSDIFYCTFDYFDNYFQHTEDNYHGDKQAIDLHSLGIYIEVWSDLEWTEIQRVIRHSTNKPIYLIDTTSGNVRVTGDHSLLLQNGTCVKPSELINGVSQLMTKCHPGQTAYGDGTVCSVRLLRENTGEYVYDLTTKNHHFAAGNGHLVVHNTDSLYICCPEACFAELDKEYLSGRINKLRYWTRMIEITMETIDQFKDDVNDLLFNDNKTKFLKMAYEEVLWPFAMVGKKKYIGIKHEGIVNLAACMPDVTLEQFSKSRSLFIRGLEVKKRGASDFLKINCFGALRDAFNINEIRTMREIFEHKLELCARAEWKPEVFVRTAKYKLPGRKPTGELKQGNVTVLLYAARMQYLEKNHPELGIKCPEVGERFPYIVARKNPWRYDLRGRKYNIKVGEKYEGFEYFENKAYHDYLGGPIEVDVDYYMTNELAGQFARFIVYHPHYDKFCKDGLDPSQLTDEEYKEADKKGVEYAKKQLVKFYNENYAYKHEDRGKYYKELYKNTSSQVGLALNRRYGDVSMIFDLTENDVTNLNENGEHKLTEFKMRTAMMERLKKEAQKLAKSGVKKQIEKFITKCGVKKSKTSDVYTLYRIFVSGKNSIHKLRRQRIREDMDRILHEMKNNIRDYQSECMKNTDIMSALAERNDALRKEAKYANKIVSKLETSNPTDICDIDLAEFLQDVDDGNTVTDQDLAIVESATLDDDAESDGSDPDAETSKPDSESPESGDSAPDAVITMFDLFTQLAACYRAEVEMSELETQLSYHKELKANNPRAKPKTLKTERLIDDLQSWLAEDNNWDTQPKGGTHITGNYGNMDLF